MKIAFPVMDDKGLDAVIADHFGRAPLYTVVDTETNNVSVLQNTGEHFGGQYSAPESLKQSHINVLICKGLGRKAIDLFNQLKIGVYLTQEIIVRDALKLYNNNKLSLATETDGCTEGQHH
ncbi:MAG: NifB/NifX family molybdenum-iron cluster-binding protein [Candidatus Heimdallarchaeota archaeon]|nr:NifB/NifX family molybdenum-iron cluster-binding protein [Candidatus Heimdallarchaeota archaeon]